MHPAILAFITGLTTGGISCLAVQGGLLASAVSINKNENTTNKDNIALVGTFLVAKIVAYTILGFLLGSLGEALTITPSVQGWMQIAAGLYMLATAANLLNLHPVFRYVVIQPPRSLMRLVRNRSKVSSLATPGILGALTVLIPCGITQGMMVLAVSSGSAITGTLIMFAFTLGTSPVFGALGFGASTLMQKITFVYIAAMTIFVLGIFSINTGQTLRGSVHTYQNYWRVLTTAPGDMNDGIVAGVNAEGMQEVSINVSSYGYKASSDTLKADVPVKLTLNSNEAYTCALAFTIPKLGITKNLKPTGTEIIKFTPTQKGRLVYTCSMGMYTGSFNVI